VVRVADVDRSGSASATCVEGSRTPSRLEVLACGLRTWPEAEALRLRAWKVAERLRVWRVVVRVADVARSGSAPATCVEGSRTPSRLEGGGSGCGRGPKRKRSGYEIDWLRKVLRVSTRRAFELGRWSICVQRHCDVYFTQAIRRSAPRHIKNSSRRDRDSHFYAGRDSGYREGHDAGAN